MLNAPRVGASPMTTWMTVVNPDGVEMSRAPWRHRVAGSAPLGQRRRRRGALDQTVTGVDEPGTGTVWTRAAVGGVQRAGMAAPRYQARAWSAPQGSTARYRIRPQ